MGWHDRLKYPLAEGRLEENFKDKKPLYTAAEALLEAQRCLYCYDAPCIKACPTAINVPKFIKQIAEDQVLGAAETILSANIMGYSCGKVCPVDVSCAGACVYTKWNRPPIQIGRLQHYAVQTALTTGAISLVRSSAVKKKKVALIGAGPASLSCAARLVLAGHSAVIFEKHKFPGGLNTTGIAPYKLKANEALREAQWLLSLGVELKTGVEVGRDIPVADLLRDYDALFLGVGLGADQRLGLEGEDGPGVFGAISMIEQLKDNAQFKLVGVEHAAVVGGGNTALDVAQELAQLGIPDVQMFYRRSEKEMRGYAFELRGARVSGARLIENTVVVGLNQRGGRLHSVTVADAERGKAVSGTEREERMDMLVVAIGQDKLTDLEKQLPGVDCDKDGCVKVEAETQRTGNPKVYAGGDCVNGGKEVVNAVDHGQRAAVAMLKSFGG